jgi:hypothetical protein
LLILHTERIVLLVFHAISSLTGRRPRILHLSMWNRPTSPGGCQTPSSTLQATDDLQP